MSTKEPNHKRIQSRQWQIIAPAEWDNLEAIKAKIKLIARNHYFILHDKDVDEFGDLKKPHWHYLFTFGSPRDLNTIENYFKDVENLLPNSYEKIGSIVWAKRYLIHADDPQKAQYNVTDVETNDLLYPELFISRLGKIDELEHVKKFMLDQLDFITFEELVHHYEGQMVQLNFQAKMSMLIRMREYYWKFHDKDKYDRMKADEEWTKINYPDNSNNSDLPF